MTSGVYAIVNKTNGKRYIGSSIDIPARWRSHAHKLRRGKHHSLHLQSAWNKYGSDNFDFVILEECGSEEILAREQFYLDRDFPEYNTIRHAGNNSGFKFSEQAIKRMSEIHTGFRHSEESKLKMSRIWAGKPRGEYSENRRAKMAAAHKGKAINENQKLGLLVGQYMPKSEETRKKISESQKGYKPTEETLEKLRQAWIRRKARVKDGA
jgi:group I intron endonuclease